MPLTGYKPCFLGIYINGLFNRVFYTVSSHPVDRSAEKALFFSKQANLERTLMQWSHFSGLMMLS